MALAFSSLAFVKIAIAQPGSLDPTFDPLSGPNGVVSRALPQLNGDVYIAGSFTSVQGTPRGRLARLNAFGVLDAGYLPGSGFNGAIQQVEQLADGRLLTAGSFSTFNGTGVPGLVLLSTTGTLDLSFSCNVQSVRCMAEQPDGKVVIAGSFTQVNGTVTTRIARLEANGVLDNSFTVGMGFDSQVDVLELDLQGRIWVAGFFTSYNGQPRPGIARLLADGSVDLSFDPGSGPFQSGLGTSGTVKSIIPLPGGGAILGGLFSSYDGTPRSGVCRILDDGQLDPTYGAPFGNPSFLYDMILGPAGELYYGRIFGVGRLLPSGLPDVSFGQPNQFPGAGTAYDLELTADGKLIAAGAFTAYMGTPRINILRINTCSTMYYADLDNDQFGDPLNVVFDCSPPTGYVLNNADCDDTDPLIQGPSQWWVDADGDGWGAPFTLVLACDQPAGYVDNDIDCDDTDPLLVPSQWCVDVDSDGHGDPNNTIWACDQPLGTVPQGALCDDCNDDDALIYPGAPCDDGDPGTSGDVYLADCSCQGLNCTTIRLELTTDSQGADLEWEVVDANNSSECSGSGFANNSNCLSDECCLESGDHFVKVRLVNGSSNFAGSYILREEDNGRIVHNPDGFSGTSAKHGSNGRFGLVMGDDRLIESRCDAQHLGSTDFLIASSNPLVAAEVVPGNWNVQSPNTGYVFWIFDPDGGYDKEFFESLRSTNGVSGGQNNRARHLDLDGSQVSQDPPPDGTLLNVRVAHRINGQTSAFGPACRFMMNSPSPPTWPNHLVDLPGDALHSCGISTFFSNSNTSNRVYAVSISGGANYRFKWTRISGGPPDVVTITRSSGNNANNRFMALSTLPSPSWMANWTDPIQPQPGDIWSVQVAHQRFGQSAWSDYGPCCTVSFDGSGNMAIDGGNELNQVEAMLLWPNPNKDGQLRIQLKNVQSSDQMLRFEFVDATGRLALERLVPLAEGENSTSLNVSGVSRGLYLVRAYIGDQVLTDRLVIE